ncbi:hypothetical protein [Streptomyces nigrescens]|uniref:hypothetical protein n=1 Tax=Streptomyces nigrescens TaxID=1920 RepID=UPI0036FD7278
MVKVTNSITGGVHAGTTIMTGSIGSLNISADGGDTSLDGIADTITDDLELRELVAEFRAELDRPGPRLAVLTKGESAVVHALLSLVGKNPTAELGLIAEEVAGRLSSRVKEYGATEAELVVEVVEFRAELDRPGPRLAVLTKGESAVVYGLLALVAGIRPDLDPIAEEVAERLAERVLEHDV